MSSREELQREVMQRASDRCEYCRMHQSLQGATLHIIPKVQGGTSNLSNLAWACPGCNLHKSDRVRVIDPETEADVPLFHPRDDKWDEHFRWQEFQVVGLTPTGRATLAALQFNADRRILMRQVEATFGLFPPTSS